MPRPAKPPMTLKEAKRAHKQDGGFRYTASQMARADRIDAREERRQKELDKEKQRRDNKRKREEKAEKDRAVRQKMLEEGKLAVEDTWGKVTASQPRLNEFFGRKAATVPSRHGLRDQIVNATDNDPQEDCGSERQNDNAQDCASGDVDQDAKASKISRVAYLETASSDPNPQTSLPQSLCQVAQDHKAIGSDQQRLSQPVRAHRPALTELKATQVNAQRHGSTQQRTPTKFETGTTQRKPNLTPSRRGVPRTAPSLRETPTTKVRMQPQQDLPLSSDGSTAWKRPTRRMAPLKEESDGGSQISKAGLNRSTGKESVAATDTSSAASFYLDEEEDFTEGIDDETFLMLCSTQKPVSNDALILTQEASQPTPESTTCPSAASEPDKSLNAEGSAAKPTTISSKGSSESFSAFFGEIDDEDFIAVAEQVESELASSAMAATAKTTPSKPNLKPQHLQKLKPQTPRIQYQPEDEYAAPGPSTQALMLELVEQAEAEMME